MALAQSSSLASPTPGHQAFLLISSVLSPMKLWASIEQQWPELAPHDVQCLWSAPLYGRQGAGLYLTASLREQIESVAELLQQGIAGCEVDLRLCKNDGHSHPLIDPLLSHPVQGLVAISLLAEAQTRESNIVGDLQLLPGVQQVRACYGETDVLMLLAASDLDAFREVLVQRIRGADGVATTSTRLVYALHGG